MLVNIAVAAMSLNLLAKGKSTQMQEAQYEIPENEYNIDYNKIMSTIIGHLIIS